MSVARVTTVTTGLPSRNFVRYGTPSNFETIGIIERIGHKQWWAQTFDGRDLGPHATKKEAVSAIVVEARL